MDFTRLFDGIGDMIGTALIVGGVVIGLPAFGVGFVLGRLTKKAKA